MPDLADLHLPNNLELKLRGHGIESLEDLVLWNAREISSIRGIGKKSLATLHQAMAMRGIALADDPLAPYQCARHGAPAWDTGLCSFVLCDECLDQFQTAFRDTPPLFTEALFGGYCQNCNTEFEAVRLTQWLLCGTCERVARSIGRGVAAEEYVAGQFERVMDGTGLTIRQIDTPMLRPLTDTAEAAIDFIIERGGEAMAGVELKTGRNHLGGWAPVGAKIGQFQLDHGDCNAITEVANRESLLVYLMHAQVIDRAAPPTTRFEPTGLWWIDPYSFSESYQSSRTRPRETKTAGYFAVDRFRPIDDFRAHYEEGDLEQLRQRLLAEGPPDLYQNE